MTDQAPTEPDTPTAAAEPVLDLTGEDAGPQDHAAIGRELVGMAWAVVSALQALRTMAASSARTLEDLVAAGDVPRPAPAISVGGPTAEEPLEAALEATLREARLVLAQLATVDAWLRAVRPVAP